MTPILVKILSNCLESHSHLVAVDLGRYVHTYRAVQQACNF